MSQDGTTFIQMAGVTTQDVTAPENGNVEVDSGSATFIVRKGEWWRVKVTDSTGPPGSSSSIKVYWQPIY